MKKCKKTIGMLMLMIIALTSLQNIVLGVTIPMSTATIEAGHRMDPPVEFFNGTQWGPMWSCYDYYEFNGKRYPAYCITHGVDGVEELGAYSVDVEETLRDVRIWRTIINGYPYKSANELGVENDDDAYFATKQAIYCVIINRDMSLYKATNKRGQKIIDAIAALKEKGLKGTQTFFGIGLSINKIGDLVQEGDYYSQKCEASAGFSNYYYKVSSISGFPEGTYIADNNGNVASESTEFGKDETFKLMIPKSKIGNNINGKIRIKLECETFPVFAGKSGSNKSQDYALTYELFGEYPMLIALQMETNTGKLQVTKVDDETNEPIEGVKFELLDEDGELVATDTTNEQGIITFSNLYEKNYQLKEVDTNENYVLNPETFDISIEYDKTTYKTITNTYKKGNVKVNKTDSETSKPIEGVKFQLLDLDENVIATGITDNNGEITFENIRIGKYKLKEIETSENYILNTSIFEVEVKYNATSVVNISNEHKRGNVIVNKVDKDNNKITLGNVVFDLFSHEFNKVVGTYATDVNGQVAINNLRTGEYSLIEKTTGMWYNLAEKAEIAVNWNVTTKTTIENELKKGQIKIIKVDKEDYEIKIPNAKFEILDKENNVLETVVTDKNGEAVTKKYAIRDYDKLKLREVETGKEYILDSNEVEVELTENQVTEVIITNVKKRGQIEITKISADDNEITGDKKGTPLQGAVFEIYSENYELLDTVTTDENGKGLSKLFECGKYHIIEVETGSENYELNTEIHDVEITEDGQIVQITIENTSVKPPKVELPKTGF